MSQIEDEYQERFKNQELSSDDFDSEDLWGAISESLNQEQSNSNKRRILLWFLFLFVVTGVIGTYSFNHNIDQHMDSSHARAGINNEEESNLDLIPSNKFDQINLEPSNSDGLDSVEKTPSNTELTKYPLTSTSGTLTALEYSSPKSSNQTEQYVFSESINSTKNPTVSSSTQQAKSLNLSTIEPIKGSIVNPTTMLPPRLYFVESDSLLQPILPLLINKNYNNVNVKPLAWEIGVWGGSNRTSFQYKSGSMDDLAKLKEQTEKAELGKSFGVNTALLWKNRWLLSTGIEYHQLWSKFEYNEEQFIQINKENQLLRVWVDAVTGDTLTSQYGNTTVNGLATRHVVNHNKYQRFSIPIGIGLQQTSSKLAYGVIASGLLSLTTTQSGKTLNRNGEIIDFDENSSQAPFKAFNLGARVSPFVGYRISTCWTIKINPQWTWQTGANFEGTDIKLNVNQFNLNLGVEYAFKLR